MIPLYKVFMPEEVTQEIGSVLNSGLLSYGEHTQLFEKKLQAYVNNPNILAISGNSIFFALKLLGIKAGDEIIASPMSCLMTTQPISYTGATVVWADIDPLTGSLNPDDVKAKITSKTKVIIHYHWAGIPGYIDEINKIAKENGVKVIEDATESFGAEYKGKKIGNTGTDIVCYSFTPVRLPNAIDGSGLSFNENDLFKKALLMRDLGINRAKFRDKLGELSEECDILLPADSNTMNNVSGLVGALQIKYLPDLLSKQRENAETWAEYFQKNMNIELLRSRADAKPSYWAYTILAKNRDELLLEFRKKGIYASKLHLRNDRYSVFGLSSETFLGVDDFSMRQLNLPSGWWVDLKSI